MLQQTQVATVLPYYYRWLDQFPDFASLAEASENHVLRAWQGLGYYTRARNLLATAQIVADRHAGVFPADPAAARELPGIGRYTANAIATFAFNRSVPLVEANISRVLARLFDVTIRIDSSPGRKTIWDLAAALLPPRGAGRFNSALMDLGALICVAGKPKCGACPVKNFCRARRPDLLPVRRKAPRLRRLVESHAFTTRRNKILLEQSSDRWHGMWILPAVRSGPSKARSIYTSIFPFTNHRVKLRVFRQRSPATANRRRRWVRIDSLDSIPIPSPHRRAIADLLP